LAIKEALKKGESVGTTDIPLKIQLVAPPLYVIGALSTDEEKGIELITNSITIIKEIIFWKKKGNLVVKAYPRVLTAKEDQNLSVLLEKLKKKRK